MLSLTLVSLAACLAVAAPTASSASSTTVKVKNGTVQGSHLSTYNQDVFLGVPFAQPPVGELRFRNPQSLNTSFNATYQATEYAPECIGYGSDQWGYPESEDCLYLNVVRPSGYENQTLPVGVWIHGGGLYEGGTRDERYNLSFIVDNSVQIGKPIIGVSIAYRLSAWGFLQSSEITGTGNTNMGLRDQRLALHWLQENLKAFGGDSSKVTIWGESAGAGSVGWHLTAYNGRDDKLFRAGIMESGNPVAYFSYKTDEELQPLYDQRGSPSSFRNALHHADLSSAVVEDAGCSDAIDNLDCLRHVPFDTLNALVNTSTSAAWSPIVDGDFIARWGSIQLAEGAFVKVPIIDGANTDEGTAFGPTGIDSTEIFLNYTSSTEESANIGSQFGPGLLKAYPNEPAYWIPPVQEVGNATYPEPYGVGYQYRRSAAYFGDAIMIANRRGAHEVWAANNVPSYSYRFNTIPAGIPWEVGVTHFQEVAFVFDNTEGLGYNAEHETTNPFEGKPQAYKDLAKLMSCSWASFIHDLDPNGFKGRYADAEPWPAYSLDEPQNIVWDANRTELAYAEADVWRKEGIQWILDHAKAYRR
ncbi:Alpha/Beta hydrolase protein [Xylariaceae sp. FL0804]|nr:Alpha/Beta hydrolase protein [Xylariaceae sp. FL0804]